MEQKIFTDQPVEKSVLTCEYSIISKAGSRPALMGWEHLSPLHPILDYEINVQIPKDLELNYRAIKMDIEPRIKKKSGQKIYRWKLGVVEPDIHEANGLHYNRDQAQLIFSSADSLFSVFNEFTSQRAFTFETSMEMRDRLGQLITGNQSDFEKFAILQNLIRQEIKSIDIPYYLTGYKIRPAIQTWESKEGTVAEQAVLLAAMIRSLSWKATPVAVVPAYLLKQDSILVLPANIDLLRIEMVEFPTQGKTFFIRPDKKTIKDASFDYPDHYLVPMEMGYSKVNLSYVNKQEIQFSWDGELIIQSDGKVKGKIDGNYLGMLNPYLGLKMDPEISNEFQAANGTSIELLRPSASLVRYYYDFNLEAEEAGTRILNLPFGTTGIESWDIDLSIPTRKTSLELPGKLRELQRIVIKLPANVEAVDARADLKLENNLGSITIRHSVENDRIELMRNITIKKSIIGPAEYPALIALLSRWFDDETREIKFRFDD
ncbi:MAG: DUF3858 domain-containing protein [Bacteroidetes bacterium]|nr:DUF3858 domain-containing protein [Bacteroidota bacterium]